MSKVYLKVVHYPNDYIPDSIDLFEGDIKKDKDQADGSTLKQEIRYFELKEDCR